MVGAEEGHVGLEERMVYSSLLSEVEGIAHGFSTRVGGKSLGACSTLNVGAGVGDRANVVRENRGLVLEAIGCTNHRWVSVKQVHGAEVVEVTRGASKSIEADGVWTRDHGAAVAVTVADCVPVLIADRSGNAVAAVHAGWRGTVAGIAAVMVERLVDAGFRKEELVVALGPCIGPEAFVVGPEVISLVKEAFPDATVRHLDGNGRGYVDLWELNHFVLTGAGLGISQIDTVKHCTATSPAFYSYRREGGDTGRQCGIIAMQG